MAFYLGKRVKVGFRNKWAFEPKKLKTQRVVI